MKKTHLLILLIFLFSCKKEKQNNEFPEQPLSAKQEAKIIFSKTLAIALEKEPILRQFIKSEALKMFDNDYDVLLQMVLQEKLGTETLSEILFKHAPSKSALQEAIETLPTLTILVPNVPNFSPETWNTSSEIPMVAIAPDNKRFKDIELYNSKLEVTKIPFGIVPGFPVVVVKENERVRILSNSNASSSKKLSSVIQTSYQNSTNKDEHKLNFQFLDPVFDGTTNISKNITTSLTSAGVGKLLQAKIDNKTSRIIEFPVGGLPAPSSLDPRVIEAFNKNVEWHRDYIYYGIDPVAGVNKGKFNNRYIEHITAIKINVPASVLSDSPEDPVSNSEIQIPRRPVPRTPQWTDGNFEIRVNILINAKSGAGATIEKIFSIAPDLLYKVVYEQVGATTKWYRVSSTPREYKLPQPEPIVAWDLENYGSQWKFVVSEFDNASTVTNTYVNSTKYATNFNFDVGFGDKVKVGAKFGASIEETQSKTYQIVTTMISDQLGEGILEFSSPVILRKENNVPYVYVSPNRPPRSNPNGPWFVDRYVTNDVSGGSFVLSVEPIYR